MDFNLFLSVEIQNIEFLINFKHIFSWLKMVILLHKVANGPILFLGCVGLRKPQWYLRNFLPKHDTSRLYSSLLWWYFFWSFHKLMSSFTTRYCGQNCSKSKGSVSSLHFAVFSVFHQCGSTNKKDSVIGMIKAMPNLKFATRCEGSLGFHLGVP